MKVITVLITIFYLLFYAMAGIAYSGMAQVDDGAYLIVHDVKNPKEGNRLGLLAIRKGKSPKYSPVKIKKWKHPDGAANDLESICKVPGTSNQYLIAESGYKKGKFGRIFHIELKNKRKKAKVLNVFNTPQIKENSDEAEGDNYEGMICFEKNASTYVVIGERGGSESFRNSVLRIGVLDLSSNKASLSWEKYQKSSIEITAPGKWPYPKQMRSISALYLDSNGIIWSVATQDPGDEGPFRSIIYQAAELTDSKNNSPIKAINNKKIYWSVDGLKVESLSGPTKLVPKSFISFGSEDEDYKGVWRPLFEYLD